MARTKPAEQRRADLLDAARDLFVSKGVTATTLEDITTRAGVSKGLFYVYFQSKDDIVCALQEDFAGQLAEQLRKTADQETDWGAKLDACVRVSFECYQQTHELHEVLFRHAVPETDDPNREPAHRVLTAAVREILNAGTTAGAYQVEDTDATARLLYVTMHAFDPTLRGDIPTTDARLIRAAQHLFRRAAGLTEPPPRQAH